MEKTQYSKLVSDIPEPDIAISMGCNVGCPFIGRPFDDNWGLMIRQENLILNLLKSYKKLKKNFRAEK